MYRKLKVKTCKQCPCLDEGKCCLGVQPGPDGCSVVIIRGAESPVSQHKEAPTYIRSGRKYKPEEILPLVSKPTAHGWSPKREVLDGDQINFRSSRLSTFKRSLRCVCCGVEGSFFVKEKHRRMREPHLSPYHLNLYGIDQQGREVLMTSDHIIPRSKAPPNLQNNRQTMCTRCNNAKGSRNITIHELRKELLGKEGAAKITEEIELTQDDILLEA